MIPALCADAKESSHVIGVAKVDVTPSEPIRLTGYASRRTNSTGVEQKLWAKALAMCQIFISLSIVVLLISRAVGIL